jgi:hypothetical protein
MEKDVDDLRRRLSIYEGILTKVAVVAAPAATAPAVAAATATPEPAPPPPKSIQRCKDVHDCATCCAWGCNNSWNLCVWAGFMAVAWAIIATLVNSAEEHLMKLPGPGNFSSGHAPFH